MKRMSYKRAAVVLAAAAIVLSGFAGCGKKQPQAVVNAVSSTAPASSVEGYYASSQALSGGQDLTGINLHDFKAERDEATGDTVVTLTFTDTEASTEESLVAAEGVPLFSTYWHSGLERLVISMKGINRWDYAVYPEETADSLLLGVFSIQPVDDRDFALYIHTRDVCAYTVQTTGNKMMIRLRGLGDQTAQWYVAVNGYDQFESNALPDDFPYYPSICSDQNNFVLVSHGFATEEEAETFSASMAEALAELLPGKVQRQARFNRDQLPEFDVNERLDEFANSPIGQKDGEPQVLPAFVPNGRFLCWEPGGTRYVFARPFFISGSLENDNFYDQLWVADTQGGAAPLIDYEFTSITTDTAFSADGRFFAFVVQEEDNRVLHVYDTKTSKLYSPTEDGLDADTPHFVWDDQKPVLYAMSGSNRMLQLMSYDLTQSDTPVVSVMEEAEVGEGSIGYHKGYVYFVYDDEAEESRSIYRLSVQPGSQRELVREGYEFYFSPNGDVMAISNISEDMDIWVEIYDLETKETTTVIDKANVLELVWNSDGSKLFFMVYPDDLDDSNPFSMQLYIYDIAAQEAKEYMRVLGGAALYVSNRPNQMMLMLLHNSVDSSIPMTYAMDIK